MKLAVSGSRLLTDEAVVWRAVEQGLASLGVDMGAVTRLLQGGCRGVDTCAARRSPVPVVTYDPRHYGAAPRCYHARNKAMAEDCDVAVVVMKVPAGEGWSVCLDPGHKDNRGSRSFLGYATGRGVRVAVVGVALERRLMRLLATPASPPAQAEHKDT